MRRAAAPFAGLLIATFAVAGCTPPASPPSRPVCCALPPLEIRVYFTTGTATPSAASTDQLPRAAAYLSSHPDKRVRIVGHADSAGSGEDNPTLSRRRADAVADALAGLGVPRERLRVEARGTADPLVPPASEGMQPQNRRVDIVID